jgi:transcriptional regulator with XRE-family HTH domain
LTRTKIAQYRVSAGFKNGQQAAKALGVSLIHIREVERGASGVSTRVAAAMAKAYKVTVLEILGAIRSARRGHHQRVLKNL